MPHPDAILLVGPTGVGKSPLGDHLERHGLGGRPCWHFDFGAHLRAAAAGAVPELSVAEVAFVREVLAGAALLEAPALPLALRLLERFLTLHRVAPADLLVMNGLPRHVGQAVALAPHLHWRGVVHLTAPAAVLAARRDRDVAGDRAGRTDDDPALVARKLEIFAARTAPLVEHFRTAGVPVHELAVNAATTAAALHRAIEALRFSP